jgi:hypothetical protein
MHMVQCAFRALSVGIFDFRDLADFTSLDISARGTKQSLLLWLFFKNLRKGVAYLLSQNADSGRMK